MDALESNAAGAENPAGPLVVQCIERALSRYGSSVASVIIWNFETTRHVSMKEILKYPEEFVQSLVNMFGVGSKIVEGSIVTEIRSTLTDLGNQRSLDLLDVLKEIGSRDQRMK